MASWIVHLRIAERILENMAGLDIECFAIGNIAPDSGIPDANWENFDPPVEVTHFAMDADSYLYDDLRFYRNYLVGERLDENMERYSFLLGYFYHLVTDNFWRKQIAQPTKERFSEEFEADDKFFREVKRDWYGLDFIYVRDHPNSIFWQWFLGSEIQESPLEFLPIEALHHRLQYIKEFYQRQDPDIQKLYARPYIYLSKEEMDQFVDRVSQALMNIYQYLSNTHPDISRYSSALELPPFAI